MKKTEFSFLKTEDVKWKGLGESYVRFAIEKQLKDETLWKKCVNLFRVNADVADGGWRGEYWGKMMRGACLAYACSGDEELYSILENTVRDLLTTQNAENGRISTYPQEEEFIGWDLWSRKYVLTGMLHFYEICKDEALKEQILTAMRRHIDYVVERIGSGEGKKEICKTSFWWQGLNSATLLEPVLALYKMTQEERYLKFGEYILSTGGLLDGNLLELATENAKKPSEYPVTKAYEMMSFFEGALGYYELKGDEYYLTAVRNFVERIKKHEITVIGCAGCTHELFDNSAEVQTEEVHEIVGQELCVTVTWMRLLARLYQTTGECWLIDEIERSWLNSLGGSLNWKGLRSFHLGFGKWIAPMPFDSYGPLYYTKRNILVGGVKVLPDGSYHGCCVSIAGAGCAMLPLNAVVQQDDALVINEYFEGDAFAQTKEGRVGVSISAGYFKKGKCTVTVYTEKPAKFAVKFRIPSWSDNATVLLGEEKVKVAGGYYVVDKEWKNGEKIVLDFDAKLQTHYLNDKVCFTYGPFVLARDQKKEKTDIKKPVALVDNAPYVFEMPEENENVRILLPTANGQILLVDYASAGKDWMDEDGCLMTVWMDKA
ncbi:MAG: glycoside hydrolase family 127 protein [Clostridia bacterium]|nr:glycoside hydrolase family 127 protein [Clostridia bacterium]